MANSTVQDCRSQVTPLLMQGCNIAANNKCSAHLWLTSVFQRASESHRAEPELRPVCRHYGANARTGPSHSRASPAMSVGHMTAHGKSSYKGAYWVSICATKHVHDFPVQWSRLWGQDAQQ